jgi:hypothetical protein
MLKEHGVFFVFLSGQWLYRKLPFLKHEIFKNCLIAVSYTAPKLVIFIYNFSQDTENGGADQ